MRHDRTPTRRLAALAVSLCLLPWTAAAFDLQGHRGARGLAPENTIASFKTALEIGVSTLELDVGITADGVVVVSHNSRLNPSLTRGPDGQWLKHVGPKLKDLTYDQLAAYDIGRINPDSSYAKRFPQQQPVDGATIPRLSDVFDLVREAGNDEVRFNIETKISPEHPDETIPPEDFVKALLKVIRDAGMSQRISIESFDWRSLLLVNRLESEIPTVCLSAEQSWFDNIRRGQAGASPWTAGMDVDAYASLPHMVKRAGCSVWSPYHGDIRPDELQFARALGLSVVTWTVNDPDVMAALIDHGVEGMITDYPGRLRDVMAEKALPLPAPTKFKKKRGGG